MCSYVRSRVPVERIKTVMAALLSLAVVCLSGCRPADEGAVAAQAAKVYYETLLSGGYETFVDGFYRSDSIPASYRSQLIDNAKMFIYQQKMEHGGISEVQLNGATLSASGSEADALLVFMFGNGGSEQVVVPMVLHDDVWYMR